jgi:hypothetical protein
MIPFSEKKYKCINILLIYKINKKAIAIFIHDSKILKCKKLLPNGNSQIYKFILAELLFIL